ncbi:Ribosomal biogenesis, methyltransferase, EMG1/NEP [Trema orientale]|uniref:Ribosomal biogenesis, methyltransferase, EMG1/NEP n=1 Tax=Trema orientale TaxID=63057 RepID=A0A2P5EHA3_TREOI|nr:Ribosomal biogenesis, methyltransferase, EMG1/NEP [Trema orientale]
MVRPYAVRGRKKKTETYDREEEEEDQQQQEPEEAIGEKGGEFELDHGIPLPLVQSEPKAKRQPGVIFILERASLEVAKVGKTYQLLNTDDHTNFLEKNKKKPGDYRPDIVHQALLAILDSPLNKAGRLRALYVRTEKGVLIEVKPFTALPRTLKRFYGLMSELLQKLSIKDRASRRKLLRVSRTLFSYSSEKMVKMQDYAAHLGDDTDIVFVVGAMAHGKIEPDYTDDFISGRQSAFIIPVKLKYGCLSDSWEANINSRKFR